MRGLVVVLWPGEKPRLEELDLGEDSTAHALRCLLGGADVVLRLIPWGPGLLAVADEDGAAKGLAGNVALSRIGAGGEHLPPYYVIGPMLVYAHDGHGQPVVMGEAHARDVAMALEAGQLGREAPCPWASGSLH